jgi:hypothetical protein
LRDGPATQDHRITKPGFRPCSRCPAHSQAPLCLCTPGTLSNRAEGTLGRLRYRLGGDRPSQTAPLPRSRGGIRPRLDQAAAQGGIPRATPPRLTAGLRRVPPILYRTTASPMAGYSQAPRGLSVQSPAPCIFTGLAISPSLSLRQCPSRYAFRAGRNLPDKEFRYLRTVIVTAAVDWGFGSAPARLPFTVQHWAGVSPYTASSDFAGTCVFGKQSLGPLRCAPPVSGRGPLLPKLRGQFAEFLNERSPARLRLLASPTCGGLGTDAARLPTGFSRPGPGTPPRRRRRVAPLAGGTDTTNGPRARPRASPAVRQRVAVADSPPLSSIDYASRPRLRSD